MTEAELRTLMVERSTSLFGRGFSVGSAGNISAAVEDGYLITPTSQHRPPHVKLGRFLISASRLVARTAAD